MLVAPLTGAPSGPVTALSSEGPLRFALSLWTHRALNQRLALSHGCLSMGVGSGRRSLDASLPFGPRNTPRVCSQPTIATSCPASGLIFCRGSWSSSSVVEALRRQYRSTPPTDLFDALRSAGLSVVEISCVDRTWLLWRIALRFAERSDPGVGGRTSISWRPLLLWVSVRVTTSSAAISSPSRECSVRTTRCESQAFSEAAGP